MRFLGETWNEMWNSFGCGKLSWTDFQWIPFVRYFVWCFSCLWERTVKLAHRLLWTRIDLLTSLSAALSFLFSSRTCCSSNSSDSSSLFCPFSSGVSDHFLSSESHPFSLMVSMPSMFHGMLSSDPMVLVPFSRCAGGLMSSVLGLFCVAGTPFSSASKKTFLGEPSGMGWRGYCRSPSCSSEPLNCKVSSSRVSCGILLSSLRCSFSSSRCESFSIGRCASSAGDRESKLKFVVFSRCIDVSSTRSSSSAPGDADCNDKKEKYVRYYYPAVTELYWNNYT